MDYDGSRPIRLKAPDSYKKAEVYSPSLGTLVLSESRTVVMLARFSGDLINSKWTEVGPTPDLSEVAQSQIRSREKQRQTRFCNFEKYHYERNDWIAFKRIAEWLQRTGRPPYDDLVASIHADRFERGGKSQILFMSRAAIVAPSCGPATIKGCLRFSAADFRVVDRADQDEEDKKVLEAAYLSRFWIPRAVCEQWFIEQGYDLPPWLEGSGTPAVELAPTVSPPTDPAKPRRLSKIAKAEIFKKWRESRGDDVPTRPEDDAHMKQFGVGRDQVRDLRDGYPSRPRGAAGHRK